ncbi:hypothetical protein MMC11_005701 [Xylographa trunciseda]|nr:hypothetical protein [Xylographa trunciseda]
MNPPRGPRKGRVPSGPRYPDPLHRGGGSDRYWKRKGWLEALPLPAPPPTRTHGNPFGFSNVPADRKVPLPFDHPLKEELAEVKRVRESRRVYWAQMSVDLPDDMDNPGSYDYQRWKEEERVAEAKIEELAGLIALAERGIMVERAGSPPVAVPVKDSGRSGNDEGCKGIMGDARVTNPQAVRLIRDNVLGGNGGVTSSTRTVGRAASQQTSNKFGTRDTQSRNWHNKPKETSGRRQARRLRSEARKRHSLSQLSGSVNWTDDTKSQAVTKWMSDIGAAADPDETRPKALLSIGSPGSSCRTRGEDEMNWSDGVAATIPLRDRQLSPRDHATQVTWSREDELHFEEAEAEREAERLELAALLNADSHRKVSVETAILVANDQVEEPLPTPLIRTERSEPAKLEIAEKKSTDLLAAIMADLDRWSPSPSPETQPRVQSPLAVESVQSRLQNPLPVRDRDQALAGAVWKALQARKAQKKAAAALEIQNEETSEWMDIDKVAPIEVMDLQDIPDIVSGEEEIETMEETERERCYVLSAPVSLSGRVLYVGNLSFEADEEQLRDAFYNFQVESVIIPQDSPQGRTSGHAFIIMNSVAEAESAIADSFEIHINNRLITVRLGTLPKQYLPMYELPRRVDETIRGRTTEAIHSPSSEARHKSLLSLRAHRESKSRIPSSSFAERFDKTTVREVEEMLNNPTISCNSMSQDQLQQHIQFVKAQLKNIKKYQARRHKGEELHFKKIRLINREEDFVTYMGELVTFTS